MCYVICLNYFWWVNLKFNNYNKNSFVLVVSRFKYDRLKGDFIVLRCFNECIRVVY